MSFNLDINKVKDSLSIISSYIHKVNEEFLQTNITGSIEKYDVTYRDPTRDWFAKDFCPQINQGAQGLLKTEEGNKFLCINNSNIKDNYIRDLLNSFKVFTKDEPYDEVEDNKRLNNYINKWKIEIPRIYDRKQHLKRLIWDSSCYFNKDNCFRSEIKSLVAEIFSPENDFCLDEFRFCGMVCKIIDFQHKYAEIKSITGLFGEYTIYGKLHAVLPNTPLVRIPLYVCQGGDEYTVRAIGKGVFDNLTKTEKISIPSQIKKCDWSFWNCKKLKSIDVYPGYEWNIQSYEGVLFDKDRKTLIAYPNCHGGEYFVPNGVEHIGNCSFKDCDIINKLYLPDTIKHIGLNAFYRCYNLEYIICDFNEKDVVFEGYLGNYGNISPQWIFKDGSTNNKLI